jgi:hypothetical protein
MSEARGRMEISDEEWENHIWVEVTTGYDQWPMFIKQRARSVCAECKNLAEHTFSNPLCKAKTVKDWVTGLKVLVPCRELNSQGLCDYFQNA